MTEPNQSSADKLIVVELIRELDRLITQLMTTTRAADEMAEWGNTLAFRELAAVTSELFSHVTRSPSKNVTDCHSTIGDEVSGLAAQALACCDLALLRERLTSAESSIRAWSPAPHVKPKRPRLVLGDDETAFAEWKKDADALTDLGRPERVAREQILAAISAVVELLDSARRNLHLGSAADEASCSIRRQPSGAFLIRFGEEVGTIKTVGAKNFVQLCRYRRVNVDFLAVESTEISASRSVSRFLEIDGVQSLRAVPLAHELGRKGFGNLRHKTKSDIEEIEIRIEACNSDQERELLESLLGQLITFQNSFWRTSDTEIKTMRRKIEKSWQRLVDECIIDMPQFAEHVSSCWAYDLVWDEYVYRHQRVEWAFLNL